MPAQSSMSTDEKACYAQCNKKWSSASFQWGAIKSPPFTDSFKTRIRALAQQYNVKVEFRMGKTTYWISAVRTKKK